jgi:hypothetical protein
VNNLKHNDSDVETQESSNSNCCICGRTLEGGVIEAHHLVPKTFKGTELVDIHRICHRKLHSTITEREMLNYYHTPERLLEHEEIVKFVEWVKKKPVDFYSKNDDTNDRKKKRRR